jgi:hypothetical protein
VSQPKKPMSLKESVLDRVPDLEALARRHPASTDLVAELASDLVSTLHSYGGAERRARAALGNVRRHADAQQNHIDGGYAPTPTWLLQAAQSYESESTAMHALAARAMEQAYVLRRLLGEQPDTAGIRQPAFPRERKQEN